MNIEMVQQFFVSVPVSDCCISWDVLYIQQTISW